MSGKRILFVDDEPNVLNALGRVLRHESYELFFAANATEAMGILEKNEVHLVVSDQRMPDLSGLEFLQQVKERYPETVRVILSGHADINLLVDSINKEVVYRFLTKPWDDAEVKNVIRQCMTHYGLLQRNRTMMDMMKGKRKPA